MKSKWNSIAVIDDHPRRMKDILMKSSIGPMMCFEIYLLNNGNLVVYVMAYDYSFAYEYDDWDEAFAQYSKYVRDEEVKELSAAKKR